MRELILQASIVSELFDMNHKTIFNLVLGDEFDIYRNRHNLKLC